MKITELSCTQFAGIRAKHLTFKDGINVIYGKNESGKSTLVNLLVRTLFQDAKLDRRTDRDFFESCFPSQKRGAAFSADFADGHITFETDRGIYTLSKEWGSDPRCMLSSPDGVTRDPAVIAAALRDALGYGEGVYRELLLSSQRNADVSLETILDASKRTEAKQEIADALTRAFAETDGISTDAIGQAIAAKLDELGGKHWDEELGLPVKKSGGRWATGLGEVLKAYYALEDAKNVLDEIERLEDDLGRAGLRYTRADAAFLEAQAACERFEKFVGVLGLRREREKRLAHLDGELKEKLSARAEWPALTAGVERARELKREADDRNKLDYYAGAKRLHDAAAQIEAQIADMPHPDAAEIAAAKAARRAAEGLENKLCGMDLLATARMEEGNKLEMRSLRTGKTQEVSGSVGISEAVSFTVPGVMELVLSPASIDVGDVKAQLASRRSALQDILKKYGAGTVEQLEEMERAYEDAVRLRTSHLDRLKAGLTNIDRTYEEVEAEAAAVVGTPRPREEIKRDVVALCGDGDISRYLFANERSVQNYESRYGSPERLGELIAEQSAEADALRAAVNSAEDIPAEYRGISDPDRYLEGLRANAKELQRDREDALTAKTAAASRLEDRRTAAPDPAADVERAKRVFEEQRALLAHWRHIAEVFEAEKAAVESDPLDGFAADFTGYLAAISGGRVTSEFPQAGRPDVCIYSDDRPVDYAKLSEGTKETVSLAFRLAVLDRLFPAGGGIAVLDDPLANMDADRAAQAAALIAAFSKRHQVIFLTCREDYLALLGGNLIRL